jgi:regulatory protein
VAGEAGGVEAQEPAGEEVEQAVALAYRALSRRDRTRAELRAALERRGVGPQAIGAAVAELTAAGYLDDAAYARRFAEDRRLLDRWGSERIARDLARRGVAPDLVDAALRRPGGRVGELDAALSLLAERFPEPPASDRERDQAWRLLVRRGYGSELAYEAVRAHEARGGAEAMLANQPDPD